MILFVLSYPPYYLSFLAPFAFIPFLFFVKERTAFESFIFGGFTGFLAGGSWLYSLFIYKWSVWLAMAIACAVFFAIYALLINLTSRKFTLKALFITPALWTVMEWLIHHKPFYLPLSFSLSQALNPMMLWVTPFWGSYALSFILLLISSFFVYKIKSKKAFFTASLTLCILVILWISTTYFYSSSVSTQTGVSDPRKRRVRLALIQANIPYHILEHSFDNPKYMKQTLGTYLELTRQAASKPMPDIIVWPETSISGINLFRFPFYKEILSDLAKKLNVWLIVGSMDKDEQGNTYNGAFIISKEGKLANHYYKTLPAPFAERYLTPGPELKVIETDAGRIGLLICYETLFPQLAEELKRKGADIILALSNDSDFQKSGGPYIHAAELAMRAAENGIYAAQVANTGVTTVVDPYGKIIANLNLKEKGIVTADIEIPASHSTKTNYGDIFVYANMAGLALFLLRTVWIRAGKC